MSVKETENAAFQKAIQDAARFAYKKAVKIDGLVAAGIIKSYDFGSDQLVCAWAFSENDPLTAMTERGLCSVASYLGGYFMRDAVVEVFSPRRFAEKFPFVVESATCENSENN